MQIALHVVLVAALAFAFAKNWQTTTSKLYWLSLAFHFAAGMAVGLIYTYYYSANDTWSFFADAKILSQIAHQDLLSYLSALVGFKDIDAINLIAQDSRSMVFIKILSFFSFITGDNYWLCTAYFALLSFVASWFLYKRITKCFEGSEVAGALAFLFFPSVVFWSSGIEKETPTLAALYFLSAFFLRFMLAEKTPKIHLPLGVLAIFVLWSLKYYWAGVFFMAVMAGLATNYLSKQGALKKYAVVIYSASFVLIGIGVTFLHPNFYLYRLLEVIVANHDAFVPLSTDQNLIHFYRLNATVSSMTVNAPWALASGIFRPFIGEGQGMLGLVASLENLLILVLAVSFVWSSRKKFRTPLSVLFLTVVSYAIVLCVFLALSTPNLGTLSRYRVGFLPFLIFIFAYRNPLIDSIAKKSFFTKK